MFTRHDSDFVSHGIRCAGWLYIPDGTQRPPIVVMAHGFGGERDMKLPEYAEKFVAQGLAVFVFDYRTFGASGGHPRYVVSPRRHLEDWQAALIHVRGLPFVDGSRLALWGTSFSGGHVIATAAKDQRVKAIVAQVPFVDGLASMGSYRISYRLRALGYALRDHWRRVTRQPPFYVPILGEPHQFAVLNGPDAIPGYRAIVPPGSAFANQCAAGILLEVLAYRPILFASRVSCPALVVIAENDLYCPAGAVEKTVARMKYAEIVRRPVGHFEVYVGAEFELVATHEAEFLARHLH